MTHRLSIVKTRHYTNRRAIGDRRLGLRDAAKAEQQISVGSKTTSLSNPCSASHPLTLDSDLLLRILRALSRDNWAPSSTMWFGRALAQTPLSPSPSI